MRRRAAPGAVSKGSSRWAATSQLFGLRLRHAPVPKQPVDEIAAARFVCHRTTCVGFGWHWGAAGSSGGDEDGVAVVEREISMMQLDGVLPVIGAMADVADQDILVTAAESCAGSARASSPRSTSGRTPPTIRCSPPSISSGRWIATATAFCPNVRPRRSCHRNGAS